MIVACVVRFDDFFFQLSPTVQGDEAAEGNCERAEMTTACDIMHDTMIMRKRETLRSTSALMLLPCTDYVIRGDMISFFRVLLGKGHLAAEFNSGGMFCSFLIFILEAKSLGRCYLYCTFEVGCT